MFESGDAALDSAAKMVAYSTPPGYQRRSRIRRPKLDTFVSMPESEASGIANHIDGLYVNHSETTQDDFAKLQDWQDFWLTNSR